MKYLAKIIASDQEGLQMISACSSAAKVKISDIMTTNPKIVNVYDKRQDIAFLFVVASCNFGVEDGPNKTGSGYNGEQYAPTNIGK